MATFVVERAPHPIRPHGVAPARAHRGAPRHRVGLRPVHGVLLKGHPNLFCTLFYLPPPSPTNPQYTEDRTPRTAEPPDHQNTKPELFWHTRVVRTARFVSSRIFLVVVLAPGTRTPSIRTATLANKGRTNRNIFHFNAHCAWVGGGCILVLHTPTICPQYP